MNMKDKLTEKDTSLDILDYIISNVERLETIEQAAINLIEEMDKVLTKDCQGDAKCSTNVQCAIRYLKIVLGKI